MDNRKQGILFIIMAGFFFADKGIRWSMIYLTGAMLQMLFVCAVKFLLKSIDISYPAVCDLIFLIIGGMSTAMWGIIISKKSGRVQ